MKKMKIIVPLVFLSLLLTMVLVLPTAPTVTAADNLAANGDLELGNTNGWEVANGAIDTATVYSGSYSLKLTATSAYSGAAYKTIPVRKNATITVSFYYRYASDPGSNLYHVFTYQGADTNTGTYSSADKSFAKPTGCNSISTWQQISYTFNSGNYTAITLKFCPGGNGGTPCYIDNLVVTSEGGDTTEMAPYLTSFGTKMGRPKDAASNLIQQGGFEATANAQWNTSGFLSGGVQVVEDSTAPEGNHSLCFDSSDVQTAAWHSFAVSVEPYTQYTFSAWVKAPRLSENNRATATFGVVNAATGKFLVYEPYNGNGHGAASISTETMQLMATAPDDAWHLRSVTFYSGSHTTVNVAVYGAESQLYLDDIALFRSSDGVEYISPLRTETLTAGNNSGNKYCADADSLIEGIYMTTNDARLSWSDNPAWRNGFLSFADVGDSHGAVLQYTASAHTERQLHYIDWIDVTSNTSYTLTLDVKRLVSGGGRIALLDDDYDSPKEFYTISFNTTDSDWITYSITFNSGAYSRIGFAIVDGGGQVQMDNVRLFETAKGVAVAPAEGQPTLKPVGTNTSVMEMSGGETPLTNGDFEQGSLAGWDVYQQTVLSADAAYGGSYGAHLKGDGTWGAMLEQVNIPVADGKTYTLTYRYKANCSGANATLKGSTTGTQYAYEWISNTAWTYVTQTFTVEGDTSLVLNLCGGGNGVAEDVYVDNFRLIPEDSTARLGVAFLMELQGNRIYMDNRHRVNLSSATVNPYEDERAYPLLRMGAVITNQTAIGKDSSAMTLDAVNNDTVANVPVQYLWDVSDDGCRFAVRVVNVPLANTATQIYARPYYVFEKDGEEIVVYGDIVNRSYDQ